MFLLNLCEKWALKTFQILVLFFSTTPQLTNFSALHIITQPDRTRPMGPSPFLFILLPVNSNKCFNYYCAMPLTSAQNLATPTPSLCKAQSGPHNEKEKLRAKEASVPSFYFLLRQRGWLSLRELMLSQCLLDVNATYEVCVCARAWFLVLEGHQRPWCTRQTK